MIALPGGYAMDAYEYGYRVGKLCVSKKNGTTYLRNTTYHTTPASAIENALQRVIRDHVEDGSITTLDRLLREMNEQRRELDMMLEPMGYCSGPREPVESEETDGTV